jgi:LuxR family transcriptional regulator, quorum-sensing system regulator BjaR1
MDLQYSYAKMAFDLIDQLDRFTTIEQVMGRFSNALSDFGYTSFLITGVPEPPQRLDPYVLLNGWPKGWTEHYNKSNYYRDDPVAAWCRRTVNPFEWSEVPIDATRAPKAAEVMRAARDFGMKKGFLVPIMRGSGFQACVTMAGERPDYEPAAKRTLHLISMYAHARCAALLGYGPDGHRRHALTAREREVLAWTAEGKSSWEIGEILGLSERTVNWHAEQAKKKLDAVNRTQAVIKALRLGEI